jgi:hypothetical protein
MVARWLPNVQKFYQNWAVFCKSRIPHKIDIFQQKQKKEGEKPDFS